MKKALDMKYQEVRLRVGPPVRQLVTKKTRKCQFIVVKQTGKSVDPKSYHLIGCSSALGVV